ncbi:MAG: PAS domain-containing sensor histidine kinase, partial [Alphaproteobacteria bacterium]|nr:PAS domain-containing sensor histidine kinase [Alphaproteobacteria bacterium]
ERMRADFVANASHELRTPLASLLGFVETLRGPARDDAEARERFLAIMHEQGTRMARLIEDLLSLSRIEMNEHSQPRGEVDLDRVLALVVETLEMKARARGMRIALDVPDDLPPVTGDADELAQVFQNLIDNAVKYGAEGSVVEVTVGHAATAPPALIRRLPAGIVSVTVRDHGDGIAREHIPRLTERFFRIDTARSRKMGGTGLGLAIVKHIVSRHRGVLAVDSEPGQGSVFTVHLPPHAKER